MVVKETDDEHYKHKRDNDTNKTGVYDKYDLARMTSFFTFSSITRN